MSNSIGEPHVSSFAQSGVPPAAPGVPAFSRPGLWRATLDHAGWVLASAAVAALLAALYAWSLPSLYQADVVLRPETDEVRGFSGRKPGNGSQVADLDLAALTSRAVLTAVVRDNRLDIVAAGHQLPVAGPLWARLKGAVSGSPVAPPLGALAQYAWGGEQISVGEFELPEAMLNQRLALTALDGTHYRLVGPDGHALLAGEVGQLAQAGGIALRVTRLSARPGTGFVLMRRDEVSAVDALARTLVVDDRTRERDPGSGLAGVAGAPAAASAGEGVRIAWRDPDRRLAVAVVGDIARSYVESQVRHRSDEAARTLAFVNAELPRVRAELEMAEGALARYRAHAGSMQPTQDAQSYLSGSIEYQRQISALGLERARLLRQYMPESQEVRAIDQQIAQLKGDRRMLDSRLQGLSEAERESVSLTRDVKVAEDTYMSLRNRAQMLSLTKSDSRSDVQLLDAAAVPLIPAGPDRLLISGAGALLGLLLGGGGAWLAARARFHMADAVTLERNCALPIVGEICFSPEQARLERQPPAQACLAAGAAPAAAPVPLLLGNATPALPQLVARTMHGLPVLSPLVATAAAAACVPAAPATPLHDRHLLARQHPHALAVEGLRGLRAALHFSMDTAENVIVAMTSATAGAGKTFNAINLAVLAAEAGWRVLIVDADLRRGDVAARFGQPASPGLADLLGGRVSLQQTIRPTAVSGLSLLAAGTPPGNPSELLMLPALRDTLQRCDESYDLVIVDTPPVLAVADATLVSRLAGATILVVRADDTPEEKVAEALKRLERAQARLIGGVLNGIRPRRGSHADTSAYLHRSAEHAI
ncbi:polysaccharide biosynthesis tyrosine autokinase [Cupriavidus basilensis]|uniref:Polysaccharide biosynthesis tyrosine autokinase n=1 Tax=Cupriavidus basilensis TaxID=68895 RepID=A0ABT6B3N3_9BURK|nr:polysaccharide biosynthesis tyrosine autokinase [Cupriavidus basilensis]MDF3839494.1 polysaccharide biosynthesis tyrosine autokinase [Cupriavidus basilensis]